jgi:hypothetical protein
MIQVKLVLAVCSILGLAGVLNGCSANGGESAESSPEALGQSSEALDVAEVCPAGVPAILAPTANETIKSSVNAVGVQTYMCSSNAAGAFVWTFVAPQANLYNDEGKLIGTHFIGPTWQGNDGSSVVGKKLQAFTADATAIPWLLLGAVSHGSEAGRFDDVTSIQRLSTVGGNAPADGCDQAHAGAIAQIPYSAQYVFYRAKDHGKVKQCGG